MSEAIAIAADDAFMQAMCESCGRLCSNESNDANESFITVDEIVIQCRVMLYRIVIEMQYFFISINQRIDLPVASMSMFTHATSTCSTTYNVQIGKLCGVSIVAVACSCSSL